MKKSRTIVRVSALVLSVLSVVGIIFLIVDDTTVQTTIYEIIVFCVGMAGMILAILEQSGSRKQEQRIERMSSEVRALFQEMREEEKEDEYVHEKLEEILSNQKRTTRKVSSQKQK